MFTVMGPDAPSDKPDSMPKALMVLPSQHAARANAGGTCLMQLLFWDWVAGGLTLT